MAESKEFKAWHKIECARRLSGKSLEEILDEQMKEENLKIEFIK